MENQKRRLPSAFFFLRTKRLISIKTRSTGEITPNWEPMNSRKCPVVILKPSARWACPAVCRKVTQLCFAFQSSTGTKHKRLIYEK